MNEDQRQQWKHAFTAKNAEQRRRRYRPRARGVQAVNGPGMVRILPPARQGRDRSGGNDER